VNKRALEQQALAKDIEEIEKLVEIEVAKGKKLIGKQTPTLQKSIGADYKLSIYDDVIDEFLQKCGIFLFPWQRKQLDEWLSMGEEGWYYATLALSVGRRNGKSELIAAYILVKTLLYNENTCYTSYHNTSMMSLFGRIKQLINANNKHGRFLRTFFDLPFKKGAGWAGPGILTGKGGETIEAKAGGKCVFMTRAGGAGRGSGFDNLIFDEAQELDAGDIEVLVPTLDSNAPQTIYAGTPESIISNNVIFGKLRDDILAGVHQNAFWAEWAVDKIEKKTNKAAWYRTNPSLGLISAGRGGLSEKTIQAKFVMSDEQFAVEILGYWKKQSANSLIDINTWKFLEAEEPEDTKTEKTALGIRFSLDGQSYSVSLASQDLDRKTFVEVLSDGSTDGPVRDIIGIDGEPSQYVNWEDYFEQVIIPIIKSKKCVSVMIDAHKSSAASLQILFAQNRLWDANKYQSKQGKISFARVGDVVAANSFFVDSVKKEEVVHPLDEVLDRAVQDACRREIRGATQGFGFASNSGAVDMSILESCVLAFYSVSISSIRKVKREGTSGNSSVMSKLGGTRSSLRMSRKSLTL
jgi:hypothetical protein